MKPIVIALIAAVIILFFGDMAYALTTRAEIHLTLRVVACLSLNLENDVFQNSSGEIGAEAFSELKKGGVIIDKIGKDESVVWLFTKTE